MISIDFLGGMTMIIKPRSESAELRLLRHLSKRMIFSEKETKYFMNLEKGFQGEQKFDEWLEPLPSSYLIINDLLIESNNTTFQIDSCIITSTDTLYLFEVKNYDGDYLIAGEKWSTVNGHPINNPVHQLQRSLTLLSRFLKPFISTELYVVFVNPDFYLYQAPVNLPIIFPSQINRFINKLKGNSLPIKERHMKLAKELIGLHSNKTNYKNVPSYTYEKLKSGITCVNCHSFNITNLKDMILCNECGQIETVKQAIMRSIEEYTLLFPNKKITTSNIHEWCNVVTSKKTIRNLLSSNFNSVGQNKGQYFVK